GHFNIIFHQFLPKALGKTPHGPLRNRIAPSIGISSHSRNRSQGENVTTSSLDKISCKLSGKVISTDQVDLHHLYKIPFLLRSNRSWNNDSGVIDQHIWNR